MGGTVWRSRALAIGGPFHGLPATDRVINRSYRGPLGADPCHPPAGLDRELPAPDQRSPFGGRQAGNLSSLPKAPIRRANSAISAWAAKMSSSDNWAQYSN